jgi:hypothetical protein
MINMLSVNNATTSDPLCPSLVDFPVFDLGYRYFENHRMSLLRQLADWMTELGECCGHARRIIPSGWSVRTTSLQMLMLPTAIASLVFVPWAV